MRQLVSTFMISIGVRVNITQPVMRDICYVVAKLVPSLDREAPRSACSDDERMTVLIRLHGQLYDKTAASAVKPDLAQTRVTPAVAAVQASDIVPSYGSG